MMKIALALIAATCLAVSAAAAAPRSAVRQAARPAARAAVAPALSPEQAKQLLSLQGTNVGTCRQLGLLGVYCISGLRITSRGRWLVIEVLPTKGGR